MLTWLGRYELIIFFNELYINYPNCIFKNKNIMVSVSIYAITYLLSMLYMRKIHKYKNHTSNLILFSVIGYIVCVSISHIIFVYIFCKYQMFLCPFSISLDKIIMFLYFYGTTFISLGIKITILSTLGKYDKLPIYEYSLYYYFALTLSIFMLIIRILSIQIDIDKTNFFILNVFMLLYFTYLLENIYMTTNYKGKIIRVLYIFSIMIMFIPTITNSLKTLNLFV